MARRPSTKKSKTVETLRHQDASRRNIPTAEYESIVRDEDMSPIQVAYERRNRDLDPQLVWRGKDEQDWSDLVVQAPPLYIQEKVHPKALIDDLVRQSKKADATGDVQLDLFSDFNGIPEGADKTDFYQHDANWSNRMILGDSLQVMASLAEREGLRGQVQCIYIDPPYGIKFNSNFQWSTTSRDVRDGDTKQITREPEQVKAFRDTWRDGVHSYLTYLRDRLAVARDLLADSGSLFIQIGDENLHRVRSLADEVFGESNFVVTIKFAKTSNLGGRYLDETVDYLLWYARDKGAVKFRRPFAQRVLGEPGATQYTYVMADDRSFRSLAGQQELDMSRVFAHDNLTSQSGGESTIFPFTLNGINIPAPKKGGWKSNAVGVERLKKAGRLILLGATPRYVRFFQDASHYPMASTWLDTGISGFGTEKVYVVQTTEKAVQRCIQMTTDPGDLVLDPTCGSGTTPYVSELTGRRWIAIDTSRVALALARARVMGARFPFFTLLDSEEGQAIRAERSGSPASTGRTQGDIRHGFVYERMPHITLRDIANNAEIDVIWDRYGREMESLRANLNTTLNQTWEDWEIPREADCGWSTEVRSQLARWWELRIARQREIDGSIAAKAEFEYLYDKPYEDNSKVRVAGPFTVESLSPHRMLGVDENGELIDSLREERADYSTVQGFPQMVLDNLQMAGVQQAHKEDRIDFTSLAPWPGQFVCAEGHYMEGETERRAAVFIGPEFGTVSRPDLVEAAREAGDAGFDVLIACAFNYDAHSTEFDKLGRIPVLKARMNADLHMSDELKNTGKGNLFVIFGEPDIEILDTADGRVQVQVKGVDVFHPQTGKVESGGPDDIACWFIDTDYNEESFFVRQAYFLGANDPYKALKTTLKAEIDEDAWATLHSDTSRPFDKPESGRFAVKVINHLGDEVLKVFRVE